MHIPGKRFREKEAKPVVIRERGMNREKKRKKENFLGASRYFGFDSVKRTAGSPVPIESEFRTAIGLKVSGRMKKKSERIVIGISAVCQRKDVESSFFSLCPVVFLFGLQEMYTYVRLGVCILVVSTHKV